MNYTQIICLANSSKFKDRCIAGIHAESARWIRPVSLDYPQDGRIPWVTSVSYGTKTLILGDIKLLDILEIPLDTTGPDFGFECENLAIIPGSWRLIGKARIEAVMPVVNFHSPILHAAEKYVSTSSLQTLPFEKRRTLELVYTDSLKITRYPRDGGGTKWKGSFTTRGGYSLNEITITDPEAFDLLDSGIFPTNPCLITMSLSMPYPPPGWTGPPDPCWKLIAGIIELSLADQILIEMHLVGWGIQQGQDYAKATYGKSSRAQLTDDEKSSFIHHLRQLSQPNP
jgi:hypothetical protein